MRIAEIFGPTIQGEGVLAGRRTMFVRVGGCDYRCKWCDSMHAVDPKHKKKWLDMPPPWIIDRLVELSTTTKLVTISGGNPAIPEDMPHLINALHDFGFTVALETQASVYREWFEKLDYLILSPKPPSSGHVLDDAVLTECLQLDNAHVKIVINDEEDYEFACGVNERHRLGVLWVQPCNPFFKGEIHDTLKENLCMRYQQLCNVALADDRTANWRILPQLHTLAWGNEIGK